MTPEKLTVEGLAEIARTRGKRAAHEALTGRAPCVWCNTPTSSRNEHDEPVCTAYECRRDDYATRLRHHKENP